MKGVSALDGSSRSLNVFLIMIMNMWSMCGVVVLHRRDVAVQDREQRRGWSQVIYCCDAGSATAREEKPETHWLLLTARG